MTGPALRGGSRGRTKVRMTMVKSRAIIAWMRTAQENPFASQFGRNQSGKTVDLPILFCRFCTTNGNTMLPTLLPDADVVIAKPLFFWK